MGGHALTALAESLLTMITEQRFAEHWIFGNPVWEERVAMWVVKGTLNMCLEYVVIVHDMTL